MESIFLMPLVIPFAIINPILLISKIVAATNKRVFGQSYTKDMFSIVMLLVSYIIFLALFF